MTSRKGTKESLQSDKTPIDLYVDAVAKRKSISKPKHTSVQVNYAVVSQLEERDVPLLLEIIRTQTRALEGVIELQERWECGEPSKSAESVQESMAMMCANAYVKSSELAESGSCAKWGDAELSVH